MRGWGMGGLPSGREHAEGRRGPAWFRRGRELATDALTIRRRFPVLSRLQRLSGYFGCKKFPVDRDRGTPRGATPPTPPGVRVTYHGGSTGLSLDRDIETGETERVGIVVTQGLLDRRVSGHA